MITFDRKTKKTLTIIVSLLAAIVLAAGGLLNLSILPGFEGMQLGIWGFQPNVYASPYALGDALPGSYQWKGVPTPSDAAVQWKDGLGFSDTSEISVGNCIDQTQSNTLPAVQYYVNNPNNASQKMHVVGYVHVYNCNIDLALTGQTWGPFSGSTWWVNFASIVWNTQSTDPMNPSINGYVWEAPLYAVVSSVSWNNQANNQVSIGTKGNQLNFYSSPNAAGQTLVQLVQFTPGDYSTLNRSLSSVYAPDSRLQRIVFSPITMTQWGPTNCFLNSPLLGCNWPSVHATITLYTIRLGEYIYTNPSKIPLGPYTTSQCTGIQCTINQIVSILQNPFLWLTTGAFILIAIAIIVGVAAFVLSTRLRSVMR